MTDTHKELLSKLPRTFYLATVPTGTTVAKKAKNTYRVRDGFGSEVMCISFRETTLLNTMVKSGVFQVHNYPSAAHPLYRRVRR